MDRLLGDGDGLFLRVRHVRPHDTKTWVVEYEFQARRRKYTIGVFDTAGAPGESITAWLEHGRLSLGQARAIAGQWKQERRAGRDPVGELEARLGAQQTAEEVTRMAAVLLGIRPDGHCQLGLNRQPRRKRSSLCESWVGAIDPLRTLGRAESGRSARSPTNQGGRRSADAAKRCRRGVRVHRRVRPYATHRARPLLRSQPEC